MSQVSIREISRDNRRVSWISRPQRELAGLLAEFLDRYPNAETARGMASQLNQLFRFAGVSHPADLTEAHIIQWATAGDPSNNTIYMRQSRARVFCAWCLREGHIETDPAANLADRLSPLRTYRKTYGKVQAKHPGRWLTHDEAYGSLVTACQDGSPVALRDEIVIRLGLAGMRCAEIASLTVRNVEQLPVITWRGKGHKPRQMTAGRSLCEAIRTYLAEYSPAVQAMTSDSPLICKQVTGRSSPKHPRPIQWGSPIADRTVFTIVNQRAALAGLGHVAPHDLRRSAAGILHNATAENGAHHFDLLDIQKVLGHSDPATTMRSYLEPMKTEVLDRASQFLD